MIARLLAFLAILYVLGFAFFAVTLGGPAPGDTPKVDAIVVITGGSGRIEHAARLLARGEGKRLLIAGADPSVRKADLVHRLGGKRKLFDCCVDLGSESVDTRSNAEEAKRWIDRALAIDPDDSHIKYNAACVWAQLGELDKAFDLLEEWAMHSGRENREWMLHDPDLAALRGHPRHKVILDLIDARIAAEARQVQPIS